MLNVRRCLYGKIKKGITAKIKLLPVEKVPFNTDIENFTGTNWRNMAPDLGQRS